MWCGWGVGWLLVSQPGASSREAGSWHRLQLAGRQAAAPYWKVISEVFFLCCFFFSLPPCSCLKQVKAGPPPSPCLSPTFSFFLRAPPGSLVINLCHRHFWLLTNGSRDRNSSSKVGLCWTRTQTRVVHFSYQESNGVTLFRSGVHMLTINLHNKSIGPKF